jgi:NitT/TauT family transport system substrate-binding protein
MAGTSRSSRRGWWAGALALAGMLVALGLAPAVSARSTPAAATAAARPWLQAPTTVRAALFSSVSDAGVYVAQDKGYFAEQGLSVEDSTFTTTSDILVAMAGGQIEVGGVPISAGFFNAYARGAIVRLVSDKGSLEPGHGYQGIVVRQDLADTIHGPADLRGRRMAITDRGISTEVAVARYVERAGLTINDVDLVTMGFGDAVAGLGNRGLDAAMSIEPIMTSLADQGIAQVLVRNDEIIPNQQNAVLAFSEPFARNEDAARRFTIAYLRGVRLYNDAFSRNDPAARADVVGILTRRTTVTNPELYDRMAMPGLHPDGAINVDSLRNDSAYFLSMGQQTAQVDVGATVDGSFVQYAAQQLGPYR